MTRDELLESLLLERFGPPQHIATERPPLVPVEHIVVCGGCGRFANDDKPCPECRRRKESA